MHEAGLLAAAVAEALAAAGPDPGRPGERSARPSGVEIRSIEDVTPLPHNGGRPRKRGRV